MKKLLIIIVLLVFVKNVYAETFYCRDLGLIVINNNSIITESQVYSKQIESNNAYYISDTNENKNIQYTYKTYCAIRWDSILSDGVTFNDVFYFDMQNIRNSLNSSFLENILKNK